MTQTAREKAEARYGGAHLSEERIAAYMEGYRQAVEEAAKVCCTSHAGDCCHETAERNAEAIRKLAGREDGKNGK